MMEVPQAAIDHVEKIINEGTDEDILALFAFDKAEPREVVAFKFQYWAYKVFPRYFESEPADFHTQFIFNMLAAYYGEHNYLNLGFRGCAKTSYTKLFLAYVLLNDMEHHRKYIKVLTRNFGNSKQIVTDVYNMIVEVKQLYGDILIRENKKQKQEESMASFTTSDQVKLLAGTIGMTQRGHVQDAYRPDLLIFDDVEDRESIQSLATTESTIWRIDEAIQGLSNTGSYMVNGNYISDEGVIQWFLNKPRMVVDKIAIQDEDGNPTWPARYDKEKIASIKDDADDFYGEYMCDPSRADTAFFERSHIDRDIEQAKQPTYEAAGVKYWGEYQPHHKYGIGADTSEGIGKDANTFAVFDFGTHPNDIGVLTATYFNNRIPPDLFGHELLRIGREFGNCIIAPEANNTGHATLATMRGYPNIYSQSDAVSSRQVKHTQRLGWRTTKKTKPQMFFDFRRDYNDGLIKIYDLNVLKEMRSYTHMDMTDTQVGMVTRHFDLLIACFVKDTLVLTDKGQTPIQDIKVGDKVMTRQGYKKVKANIAHPKKVITNIGLTGTSDHPVFCNGTIKDLSQVSHGDTLTVWNESKQAIENMSYTEMLNTIGTPNQNTGITGFIFLVGRQIKNHLSIYTELFGKTTMVQFLKDIVSTIKTTIRSIIQSITLKSYLIVNTCVYTCKNQEEKSNYVKQSKKTDPSSTNQSEEALRPEKKKIAHANGVVRFLKHLLTTLVSVAVPVHTDHKMNVKRSHTKQDNAPSVAQSIEQENQTKDTVDQIASQKEEEKIQTVYNLQVEDCPEYFANNILVHNCVIAWQMRKHATFRAQHSALPAEDEPLFADIGL